MMQVPSDTLTGIFLIFVHFDALSKQSSIKVKSQILILTVL